MPEISAALGLIEKGGILAVFLIAGFFGYREIQRLRAELAALYKQRDKWRIGFVKCKSALDHANIKVDLSDIADLIGEGS